MNMCGKCREIMAWEYFENLTDRCLTCRFWNRTNAGDVKDNECREDSPKGGGGSFSIMPATGWCGKHKSIPGIKTGARLCTHK